MIAGGIKHSETLNCTGIRKSKNRKDEMLHLVLVQRIRDKKEGWNHSWINTKTIVKSPASCNRSMKRTKPPIKPLYGLAQGTAQHAFITAKMERIGECHEALKVLVGEHEANMLLAETLEQAGTGQVAERIA